MWAQIATTLTGKKESRRKWSLVEMTTEREKNDLLWFLYFPFMTDGKRHLLHDILQTSKNDYYKEWQSFRKHDGAWRNNLSKIHLLNLYAWMESNFLFFFFSNTLLGPNIASPPSPARFLSSNISVIYELYINRETVTSQGHHSRPPILLQDEGPGD